MLTGSIVALVTPMHKDGSIDFPALEGLINWHLKSGTQGIVLGGSTGESVCLAENEYAILIEKALAFANNRIPIVAGASSSSTVGVIERIRQAKKAGAQSVMCVVPYYNKPTQEGIYQHFATIAETIDIQIYLYNVPSRTAIDMHNDTVVRLSKIDNIVGLKDATANLERACELLSVLPDSFGLYSGDDGTAMAFILCGGHGAISVCANIVPNAFQRMCQLALSGNLLEARLQNSILQKLYKCLFIETNPSPAKWMLSQLGWINNYVRLPLLPLSSQSEKIAKATLQEIGIFNERLVNRQ